MVAKEALSKQCRSYGQSYTHKLNMQSYAPTWVWQSYTHKLKLQSYVSTTGWPKSRHALAPASVINFWMIFARLSKVVISGSDKWTNGQMDKWICRFQMDQIWQKFRRQIFGQLFFSAKPNKNFQLVCFDQNSIRDLNSWLMLPQRLQFLFSWILLLKRQKRWKIAFFQNSLKLGLLVSPKKAARASFESK